jgi:hypothetical protein
MSHWSPPSDPTETPIASSQYDPRALKVRAHQWRVEADRTHSEIRDFCLDQAAQCDRRLESSLSTPVLRE